MAAFPLLHEKAVLGTLNIYSAEPNHFDAEEVALLVELAGDLALGLGLIRAHQARQVAEQSLAESEFRWKFALEGAGDGLWDWDMTTGTVFFSRRWKEMLGFTADEITNRIEECARRIHPEDQPGVTADAQAHFAGVTSVYSNEHRLQCKDGSWKWVLDRGMVVARDATGQPTRMIGTHQDLSERKQAEEALRKTAEELVARNDVLARFNRVAVDRELRMVELKRELNGLCQQHGEPPRYVIPVLPAPPSPHA